MKKKKTTPDPLAKVSAPNLRRLVKRLRARVIELEYALGVRTDALDAAYRHIAALQQATQVSEPPDGRVLVSEHGERHPQSWMHWDLCVSTIYTFVTDGFVCVAERRGILGCQNTPPTHPAPCLDTIAHPTHTTRFWRLWWFAHGHLLVALTCPAVVDSVEGRKALVGVEAVGIWRGTFGIDACVWYAPPSLANIRVPPLTWRPA